MKNFSQLVLAFILTLMVSSVTWGGGITSNSENAKPNEVFVKELYDKKYISENQYNKINQDYFTTKKSEKTIELPPSKEVIGPVVSAQKSEPENKVAEKSVSDKVLGYVSFINAIKLLAVVAFLVCFWATITNIIKRIWFLIIQVPTIIYQSVFLLGTVLATFASFISTSPHANFISLFGMFASPLVVGWMRLVYHKTPIYLFQFLFAICSLIVALSPVFNTLPAIDYVALIGIVGILGIMAWVEDVYELSKYFVIGKFLLKILGEAAVVAQVLFVYFTAWYIYYSSSTVLSVISLSAFIVFTALLSMRVMNSVFSLNEKKEVVGMYAIAAVSFVVYVLLYSLSAEQVNYEVFTLYVRHFVWICSIGIIVPLCALALPLNELRRASSFSLKALTLLSAYMVWLAYHYDSMIIGAVAVILVTISLQQMIGQSLHSARLSSEINTLFSVSVSNALMLSLLFIQNGFDIQTELAVFKPSIQFLNLVVLMGILLVGSNPWKKSATKYAYSVALLTSFVFGLMLYFVGNMPMIGSIIAIFGLIWLLMWSGYMAYRSGMMVGSGAAGIILYSLAINLEKHQDLFLYAFKNFALY